MGFRVCVCTHMCTLELIRDMGRRGLILFPSINLGAELPPMPRGLPSGFSLPPRAPQPYSHF